MVWYISACLYLVSVAYCMFSTQKNTGAYSFWPPLSVTKNVIHAYPRLTSWCSYLAAGYSEDTSRLTFCLRRKSNASWILPSPSNISDPGIDFPLLYGIFSPETVSRSWRRSFPSLRSVYRSSMWRWCTFCSYKCALVYTNVPKYNNLKYMFRYISIQPSSL